jgi:hypothetical protein
LRAEFQLTLKERLIYRSRSPLGGGRMNTTNIIKLVACLAWAGVAIASAAPADASAATTQSGAYASCSASWSFYTDNGKMCWSTFWSSYTQQIKFVSTTCNTGGCGGDQGTVYVDSIYPAGRKTTGPSDMECMSSTYHLYELGTCAC